MTIKTKEHLHGIAVAEAGTAPTHYSLYDIAQHCKINLEKFYPIGITGQILSNTNKVNKDDTGIYYGINLNLMLIETSKYNKLINNELTPIELESLQYHSFPVLEGGDLKDLVSKLKGFHFILGEKCLIEPLNLIFKDSGFDLYNITSASYDNRLEYTLPT